MPGPGSAPASRVRVIPKATSSAVTGSPVSQVASSRSWKVHSVKSLLGVPRSTARSGTSSILPVSGSRANWVSERLVSACWIELPVTDQPSAGSSESGPGSPGK